ncbi:hypothetical protein KXD40_002343 [Peronospora effusa]|uniref:Uncharacterized protein n=1 Tax=Peronospora effusa TaxID=542832 RepID=A0A3M6VJB4_9STRA|nr:hypothetical protein DD238_002837 [Peronospora effusa]UIZ26924.1 hypothetical protein KXD40_002343 [Peronospora effusa]
MENCRAAVFGVIPDDAFTLPKQLLLTKGLLHTIVYKATSVLVVANTARAANFTGRLRDAAKKQATKENVNALKEITRVALTAA